MKFTKKIIILSVSVIIILLTLILMIKDNDKPFNMVTLSRNNKIINNVLPKYHDTILRVGLDLIDIKNITIIILPLSDNTKQQFDGNLSAHVRFSNGVYYLFMDKLNKEESLSILSHEIIHIQQYYNNDLIVSPNLSINWKNEEYLLEKIPYEERPWEIDAYQRQVALEKSIDQVLY